VISVAALCGAVPFVADDKEVSGGELASRIGLLAAATILVVLAIVFAFSREAQWTGRL
jgi:hypothetical protein